MGSGAAAKALVVQAALKIAPANGIERLDFMVETNRLTTHRAYLRLTGKHAALATSLQNLTTESRAIEEFTVTAALRTASREARWFKKAWWEYCARVRRARWS